MVDEVVSKDYVERADTPGFSPDREGLKGFIAAVRTAFPNLKYTVIKEISEGDTLVQYVTASGTMKGDFGDMKATGKHATWEEVGCPGPAGHAAAARPGARARHVAGGLIEYSVLWDGCGRPHSRSRPSVTLGSGGGLEGRLKSRSGGASSPPTCDDSRECVVLLQG